MNACIKSESARANVVWPAAAQQVSLLDKFAVAIAVPKSPWRYTTKERRWDIDGLPRLRSLDFEKAVLRTSVLAPDRNIFYRRTITLEKQRSIGMARVAKAALQAGYQPHEIEYFLLEIASLIADDFFFTKICAREIVAAAQAEPRRWIVKPAGKYPRVVGVYK